MSEETPHLETPPAALLDRIYASIRAPQEWREILPEIGAYLGADIGLMLSPSLPGVGAVPLFAFGLDMTVIADVYPKYAGRAEFTTRALATGRTPGAFLVDELMPPAEQATNPFWQEVAVPLGVTSGIFTMVRTPDENRRAVIMNFYRVGERPKYGPDDVKAMDALIPHLRRALGVILDAPPQQASAPDVKELYNAVGAPCFFFAADGRVAQCNHAAELLLQAGDGVELRDAKLWLWDKAAQSELNAALARTIGEGWSAKFRTGAELLARRPSGGSPLVLVATPIGADGPIAAVAAPIRCALFVLEERLRANGFLPERLQRLYGLTSAEADIAIEIASGAVPAEVAERRGTTAATVRTQVKTALRKTGARRQADLAALVNRLRF
jgi:DNA-binding CsgD family transcriptional regulator